MKRWLINDRFFVYAADKTQALEKFSPFMSDSVSECVTVDAGESLRVARVGRWNPKRTGEIS